MKLSDLELDNLKVKEPALSIYDDNIITSVVYDGIKDDMKNNKWCIVFGNSSQINERAKATFEKYKEKRFEKIVLCGGSSNINNKESEANRIRKILIEKGIPDNCIYMDEKSQNTFENIDNAMKIILENENNINSLSIITSEYHLKRCFLSFVKKYPNISITTIPAYDGYSDKLNWFKDSNEWNRGRCMVIWERNMLTKYAKDGKIVDCEINKE